MTNDVTDDDNDAGRYNWRRASPHQISTCRIIAAVSPPAAHLRHDVSTGAVVIRRRQRFHEFRAANNLR